MPTRQPNHHRSTNNSRLRQSVTCALAILCTTPAYFAISGIAYAEAATETRAATATQHYAISAGPLAPALRSLASSANVLLTFTDAQVLGKTTGGIDGNYTLSAALSALLAGTGLQAVQVSGGGYVLRIALEVGVSTTLPEVAVKATREKDVEIASGKVGGFVAKRSATATKTDTPLLETPQSVSVIPQEQIKAQAADSLDQAFQYTAGISLFEGGGTRNVGTRFVVRGFSTLGSTALYLNGSKFPTNSLTGSMEPYHFERIELLKGPASIMYGQTTPGGVINLVSKRPTAKPMGEVELQLGSWDRKQIAMDIGGPVTEDGRIRYRLTALQRDSDSMIKEYANDKTSLSGALEWQLSDATLLTLLGTSDRTRAAFDAGKPLDGTLLPNPGGKISRHRFLGESKQEKYDGDGGSLAYLLEHRFNDAWKFRQHLLAYDRDIDWNYMSISSRVTAANPRLVNRTAVSRIDKDKGVSIDNQLHGKIVHGQFEHNLLVGLDWSKSDFSRSQRVGMMTPIDLFTPVYGAQPAYGPARQSRNVMKQLGVYVQDQIKFDGHWVALIGGRYDSTHSDQGSGTVTEEAHAFTPRLGLMYLFDNGLTPYYSYSRSFEPVSGTDFNLRRFKPVTGTQHEVGLKYEPQGMNASVTAAAYEITQRNNLTSDPNNLGSLIQTGETRSRGFELEGRAELHQQLSLIAAFAVTDAKITESNQGNVGTTPASVPRNTVSLWADHQSTLLPGLSLGLGLRRVGEQEVNRMAVPSYTVYDAALRYQWAAWQFALNIKNLTDKTYIAACPSVCYYGDERNVLFTARLNW